MWREELKIQIWKKLEKKLGILKVFNLYWFLSNVVNVIFFLIQFKYLQNSVNWGSQLYFFEIPRNQG